MPLLLLLVPAALTARERPDILLITVDTLRADRLSSYGHYRQTSPNIDRLLEGAVHFTRARTPEPLTNPAMTSMVTSLYPHEHGATRNGLRMRRGLLSLPKILQRRNYETAAFVASWTLKDKISRLGEHFEHYNEVLTRKRWLGLVSAEASAVDVTDEALAWLRGFLGKRKAKPFLLWLHYVEPHAPYIFHDEFVDQLELRRRRTASTADSYDSEIAFVDREIGRLLSELSNHLDLSKTLVVFTADHGESLGEHNYLGHGRHLYEPTLHVPMGLAWPSYLAPREIGAPADLLDLAPTILGLLKLPIPEEFRGYDWTDALINGGALPHDRITFYQAHKGHVRNQSAAERGRRKGLLEVGMIQHERKELFRVKGGRQEIFDLERDPSEVENLLDDSAPPSSELVKWMGQVHEGLDALERLPIQKLDEESIEKLRALGYVE